MFSNLNQNSILYILDMQDTPKLLSGPIERISPLKSNYNNTTHTMEMVVDIIANIGGESKEFKSVPNGTIANFGIDAFILAENKEELNAYVNSMIQNSKSILENMDKHKRIVETYENALVELNPSIKADKEKDKAIQSLQDQVSALQNGMQQLLSMMNKNEAVKTN